ncbi:hypothetical protein [Agrococcus baldri]|uniref:hypothetical protein n=1 Tax=Agrococcus baldri TaxID=153730 RepID=UPI0011604C39|nr:hypothetical protein [Agrococcus baldri]
MALQATVLRLMTITEAFCVGRLVELADLSSEANAASPRRAMLDDALMHASGSWQAMERAFKDWHSVKPSWSSLRGPTEVRNAVAHGLGALTHRQKLSRTATVSRINSVGAGVNEFDRIRLDPAIVTAIAEVCATFIRDLDARSFREF